MSPVSGFLVTSKMLSNEITDHYIVALFPLKGFRLENSCKF